MKTICLSCGKVKQVDGSWKKEDHVDTGDSTGVCPECFKELKIKIDLRKETS